MCGTCPYNSAKCGAGHFANQNALLGLVQPWASCSNHPPRISRLCVTRVADCFAISRLLGLRNPFCQHTTAFDPSLPPCSNNQLDAPAATALATALEAVTSLTTLDMT